MSSAPSNRIRKGVLYQMLPESLPLADRFKLARDTGWDGVEAPPIVDPAEAERMRAGAEAAGLRIHSVIFGGWDAPLSHPDAAVRDRGVRACEAALRGAKAMGADALLLVPGIVNETTGYKEAYERSQACVRRLVPVAENVRVHLLIEEVWNNFLLSPLEFAGYVDSFRSPWVGAYFDVGNVVPFGWPEDWIKILGKRIRKVHFKDFKGGPGLFGAVGSGKFVNLRDGSIAWPRVRAALAEIGYSDFVTVELGGGDEAYLRDVSRRVDQILDGA